MYAHHCNSILRLTKYTLIELEACSTRSSMTTTVSLIKTEPKQKHGWRGIIMAVLLKGHDIKLPLSIYIYTHTQELLSVLTTQASFCSGWH